MNIFVGNIPAGVTPDDFRHLFDDYGNIINIHIKRDAETGLPLGYGHVYLVPEEAAYEAIVNLNNTNLKGSTIVVRECVYRAQPDRRKKNKPWTGGERRLTGSRRRYSDALPSPVVQQQNFG
jgi:RNA-binding motif X-linked protein 2